MFHLTRHVRKFALKNAPERARCLYRLNDPVSPHLAKALAREVSIGVPYVFLCSHVSDGIIPLKGPSEADVLISLKSALSEEAEYGNKDELINTAFVETAGGLSALRVSTLWFDTLLQAFSVPCSTVRCKRTCIANFVSPPFLSVILVSEASPPLCPLTKHSSYEDMMSWGRS